MKKNAVKKKILIKVVGVFFQKISKKNDTKKAHKEKKKKTKKKKKT